MSDFPRPPAPRTLPVRIYLVVVLAAMTVVAAGVTLTMTTQGSGSAASLKDSSVAISVDSQKIGSFVTDDAFGISLEATDYDQLAPGGNLAALLKTSGPGVVRIGGDSSDDTFWTSTNEQAPTWAKVTIGPQSFEHLDAVLKDSGWKAIIGLDFKHFDPKRAADEAQIAKRILGPRLKAVGIGNEPNIYYDDVDKFLSDYDAYLTAIKAAVPDLPVIGPETSTSANSRKLLDSFVAKYAGKGPVAALSHHRYSQTACDGKKPNLDQLLSGAGYSTDKKGAEDLVGIAKKSGLPVFLDETNSVSCEGQSGVSDVYGSALWAVGYGLSAASAGVDGVYFHGSLDRCGGSKPAYKDYTALCADSKKSLASGQFRGQPIYYGLSFLGRLGAGNFVAVDNPNWQTFRVFAVRDKTKLTIAILNVANPRDAGVTRAHISVDGHHSRVSAVRLTNDEKKLTAKKGTRLGAKSLAESGTLNGLQTEAVRYDGSAIDIDVDSASAVLVTLE